MMPLLLAGMLVLMLLSVRLMVGVTVVLPLVVLCVLLLLVRRHRARRRQRSAIPLAWRRVVTVSVLEPEGRQVVMMLEVLLRRESRRR